MASKASLPAGAQSAVEAALARSFIYRYLAQAYADPDPQSWEWLASPKTIALVCSAAALVSQPVSAPAQALFKALDPQALASFRDGRLALFGHAARGSCPLNEIEYGDIKADPLFQPHRLADLAAFYRAFGLELAEDASERHDHLCLELEFMCVLTAKEAYLIEHGAEAAQLDHCRDAQRKFLREHLGRWTPAFCRRLLAATSEPGLCGLAELTQAFIDAECHAFGVTVGSQDLLLRPVDDVEDRMCDGCGINNLPPGAAANP